MKKVLILAYDFPPYVSVGGLRPYNWLKYLKEFGVEPIVVTRQWENKHGNELDYISPSKSDAVIVEQIEYGTIIRAPYFPSLSNRMLLKYGEKKLRFIRKSLTALDEMRQFIWVSGPKKQLYYAAKTYLKNNQVDAIIATGDPFVLFSFASKLSEEFDIPWLADYRDPWSKNIDKKSNFSLKNFNTHFEKKLLSTSSGVITVSEFLKHDIVSLGINKPFHILPNGYDHELIEKTAKIEQSHDSLNIAFVGTIYEWHPWESFILHFCQFIHEHPESTIKVNFYGVNGRDTIEAFIKDNYPAYVNYFSFTPRIPNQEVLEKLAENNIMLLFNYYSYMGTKIFDYLGVRRKIILCYSNDNEANALKDKYFRIDAVEGISQTLQADLIEETTSGIVVKDSKHLLQVLDDLWKEFSVSQKIECNSVGVERFSRKEQTEKLAEIIKNSTN